MWCFALPLPSEKKNENKDRSTKKGGKKCEVKKFSLDALVNISHAKFYSQKS